MGAITFSSAVVGPNSILSGFTSILTAYVGVVVLAAILPFAASLILDGIVHLFRGRGLKPLMIATGLTVGVAVAGIFATSHGQPSSGPTPEVSAGMALVVEFLLPFSISLALIAFGIRMISLLAKGSSLRSVRS